MIAWPGLEAYNAALAGGSAKLLPADLAGSKAAVNAWGIPNALSGGFAFIYELTLPSGRRRALRLFHTGREERIVGLREAYRAVDGLRRSGSRLKDYLVEARWEDACIEAGGRAVPGIVMDWVDAPTLGAWLERNHSDRAALGEVRGKLAELQASLEESGMVHGDIQTGNIAVRGRGGDLSLVLLDYDGFRPAGAASSASEEGHVHFRHPDPACHGPTADRFPFLSMDVGLQALASDASLFARYSVGENVLFTGDDYRSPGSSGAVAALSGLDGMGRAGEYFAALCRGASSAVPTIVQFRAAAGMADIGMAAMPQAGKSDAGLPGAVLPAPLSRRDPAAADGAARSAMPLPVAEGAYLGQYAVLDPRNYLAVGAAVGSKVELVGRIVSIKEGMTKYGKPYVFANFGDWRKNGTKLIWWSEGLEAFGDRAPGEGWEGRWVSVMGLVDEPYRNDRFGTVQYSLTVLDPSQLRFLSVQEAERRLSLADILSSADPGAVPRAQRAGTANSPKPSNAEILASLRAQPAAAAPAASTSPAAPAAPGAPTAPAASAPQNAKPPVYPPARNSQPPAAPNSPDAPTSAGCLLKALGIIGLVLFLLWMAGI